MIGLMPLAAFPGKAGWGYDGVGPWAVHEAYGGPGSLQQLIDAAHARGIGGCLDVVYNHLGPSGNYLAEFGPYFTDAHDTPWGPAINLDGPGSRHVRDFIIDSALRWFTDFRRETFQESNTDRVVSPSYGDHWFAMRRGPLVVILNRGHEPATIEVADAEIELAFCADGTHAASTMADVTVPGRSSVILRIGVPTPP